MLANDSHVHFARTRAISELDSGNREDLFPDFFLDHRFSHHRDLVEPPLDWRRTYGDRAQDRHRMRAKHWLQFTRGSGQKKNVRRLDFRIDVRFQIQSGRAAIFVRKTLSAFWHLSLPRDA